MPSAYLNSSPKAPLLVLHVFILILYVMLLLPFNVGALCD